MGMLKDLYGWKARLFDIVDEIEATKTSLLESLVKRSYTPEKLVGLSVVGFFMHAFGMWLTT